MKAILTFHSIDDTGSVLSFPVSKFAQLIEDLIKGDTKICSLDDIVNLSTDNAVCITFDDGMESVFKNALPVLKAAGVPSHLYLTTDAVGQDNRWSTQPRHAPLFDMMDWQQLEQCVAGGMLMENHTCSHPFLTALNDDEISSECDTADAVIVEHFGRSPIHFAYPYGDFDKRVSELINSKYKSAVTTTLLPVTNSSNPAELPRLDAYYLQQRERYTPFFNLKDDLYLKFRYYMRAVKSALH